MLLLMMMERVIVIIVVILLLLMCVVLCVRSLLPFLVSSDELKTATTLDGLGWSTMTGKRGGG
jgi:hypothetical protein